MTFENINLVHVLLAGIAAWLLGFLYYTVLSKPYRAGMTAAELAACQNGENNKWLPFAVCLIGAVVMAYVLAALLNYVAPNAITARAGAVSAFFVWLGFILPPLVINAIFAKRRPAIILIDAGYWLLAALLQGALLGAFASGEIALPV